MPRRRQILFPAPLILLLLCVETAPLQAQSAGTYGHYTVDDPDRFSVEEYRARRKSALSRLAPGEALLVRSAPQVIRSNDVEYAYRQRSNYLYLTGLTEMNGAILLVKDGVDLGDTTLQEVLFVADRDPIHEQWEGVRMGTEVAPDLTGLRRGERIEEIPVILRDLLSRLGTLYYDNWEVARTTEAISGKSIDLLPIMRDTIEAWLGDTIPRIEDAGVILDPLRLIKSPEEIAMIRRAVDASIEGHRRAIRAARPEIAEYELEAEMEYAFVINGAEGPAYGSIVGSGPNTCILHYKTNRRRTRPGDLVLMDCGAEYRGYAADITRTFPVNGRFTTEQRAIYELVLRAQKEAIEECREGKEFWDPHRRALSIMAQGLVDLGIVKELKDARRYIPHGTSHYLGLDVHDVGSHRILRTGMVLTVEPGIYIPAGSDCDRRWWDIGVRIEDDILVSRQNPVNLSEELEKEIDEIEALMSGE